MAEARKFWPIVVVETRDYLIAVEADTEAEAVEFANSEAGLGAGIWSLLDECGQDEIEAHALDPAEVTAWGDGVDMVLEMAEEDPSRFALTRTAPDA